jgi:hypothetical protein
MTTKRFRQRVLKQRNARSGGGLCRVQVPNIYLGMRITAMFHRPMQRLGLCVCKGSGPRKLGQGAVGNNRHWSESKWRDGSIMAGSSNLGKAEM